MQRLSMPTGYDSDDEKPGRVYTPAQTPINTNNTKEQKTEAVVTPIGMMNLKELEAEYIRLGVEMEATLDISEDDHLKRMSEINARINDIKAKEDEEALKKIFAESEEAEQQRLKDLAEREEKELQNQINQAKELSREEILAQNEALNEATKQKIISLQTVASRFTNTENSDALNTLAANAFIALEEIFVKAKEEVDPNAREKMQAVLLPLKDFIASQDEKLKTLLNDIDILKKKAAETINGLATDGHSILRAMGISIESPLYIDLISIKYAAHTAVDKASANAMRSLEKPTVLDDMRAQIQVALEPLEAHVTKIKGFEQSWRNHMLESLTSRGQTALDRINKHINELNHADKQCDRQRDFTEKCSATNDFATLNLFKQYVEDLEKEADEAFKQHLSRVAEITKGDGLFKIAGLFTQASLLMSKPDYKHYTGWVLDLSLSELNKKKTKAENIIETIYREEKAKSHVDIDTMQNKINNMRNRMNEQINPVVQEFQDFCIKKHEFFNAKFKVSIAKRKKAAVEQLTILNLLDDNAKLNATTRQQALDTICSACTCREDLLKIEEHTKKLKEQVKTAYKELTEQINTAKADAKQKAAKADADKAAAKETNRQDFLIQQNILLAGERIGKLVALAPEEKQDSVKSAYESQLAGITESVTDQALTLQNLQAFNVTLDTILQSKIQDKANEAAKKAAADKIVADKVAADKAAAEKAAADKVAADKAAAEKAAADKAAADKAAAKKEAEEKAAAEKAAKAKADSNKAQWRFKFGNEKPTARKGLIDADLDDDGLEKNTQGNPVSVIVHTQPSRRVDHYTPPARTEEEMKLPRRSRLFDGHTKYVKDTSTEEGTELQSLPPLTNGNP